MSQIVIPINAKPGDELIIKIKMPYTPLSLTPTTKPPLEDILKDVCEELGLSTAILKSKARKHEIVYARNLYYLIAKLYTNKSLFKIGQLVSRDHTTVSHGILEIKEKTKQKYELAIKYISIMKNKYPNIL